MPRYLVRSRETRVYDWEVDADSEEEAKEWVEEQNGNTEYAKSDQYDSTEIIDVTLMEG